MVRVRRREGSRIIMEVLRAALGGAKKTHIQFRANLNPEMLNRYLSLMMRSGLIERYVNSDGDALYRTTEEGRALLRVGEEFYTLLWKKLKGF